MSLKSDLIILGAAAAVLVIAYGAVKNKLGAGLGGGGLISGALTGTAGLLFGDKAISGGYGEDLGNQFWPTPVGSRLANIIWDPAQLNIEKTDAAFSNVGMTTQQVQAAFKTGIPYNQLQNAMFGGSLSPAQIDQLRSLGWTGTGGEYAGYQLKNSPLDPEQLAYDPANGWRFV